MTVQSPTEISEKWANMLSASVPQIERGVMAVKESPTKKAAQSLDLLLENLRKKIESGEMAAALNSVTLDDWQRAFIDKGLNRIATGARAAEPKFEKFMGQLLSHISVVKSEVDKVPRGDFEQNLRRMEINARGMKRFKFKK